MTSLAHINIFTPKPGSMDEFIAVQLQALPALAVPGSSGSRLYRAKDGRRAILIAFFTDEAAHRRFMEAPAFQRHRERLLPLLEDTTPGYFTLVYSRDNGSQDEEISSAIGF